MSSVNLDPGYEFTFPRPQNVIVAVADAGQDTGLCLIDYTAGPSTQQTVSHYGRPADECLIHRLEDAAGNVVGLIDTVTNIGAYRIVVDYT